MMPLFSKGLTEDSLLTSNSVVHHLLILSVAALLCLPCLLTGIPSGYDAVTHVSYQHDFNQQFWNGELYPRWLVHSNKGYGSPTFFIQYPFPYFVTAFLRLIPLSAPAIYRESRELGIFCFLVMAAAGFASRFWFRRRFSPLSSTLAAIVYISLPYVISCLYARTAIGELSTFVWMPLVLAMCDSIGPRTIGFLGLFAALLILSNPLIAFLFIPACILYVLGETRQSPKATASRVTLVSTGFLLGVGISAVYFLPFLAYRRFFDPSQMQVHLPGFELGAYFASLTSDSIVGQKLGLLVLACALLFAVVVARYIWLLTSDWKIQVCMIATLALGVLSAIPNLGSKVILASGLRVAGFDPVVGFSLGLVNTALVTVGLGFLAYCRVVQKHTDWRNAALLMIASSTFILMLPWSAPIWNAIPVLAVLQFPFRIGAILTVAVAGLVAAAIDDCLLGKYYVNRKPSRRFITLAIAATVIMSLLAWRIDRRFRNPRIVLPNPDTYLDINYRMYVPPDRIARFAEMLGTTPGSYTVTPSLARTEPEVHLSAGQGSASVKRVGFREFLISVDSPTGGVLQLDQIYFPLWRVSSSLPQPNQTSVRSSPDGLVEIPVLPGKQNLSVVLIRDVPERYGFALTVASLLGAFILTLLFRGRSSRALNAVDSPSPP